MTDEKTEAKTEAKTSRKVRLDAESELRIITEAYRRTAEDYNEMMGTPILPKTMAELKTLVELDTLADASTHLKQMREHIRAAARHVNKKFMAAKF